LETLMRTCRACGCDDDHACAGDATFGAPPCYWVLLDIETPTGVCSTCAAELAWHPIVLLNIGREDEPELLRAAGGHR
jgi:hypothetical protein